jgi:hypothetical protein
MNVKELIIAQLKAMGADGLVCPDEDCGSLPGIPET